MRKKCPLASNASRSMRKIISMRSRLGVIGVVVHYVYSYIVVLVR